MDTHDVVNQATPLADYNVLAGGLMPLGLMVLSFAPWVASKIRPPPSSINQTHCGP